MKKLMLLGALTIGCWGGAQEEVASTSSALDDDRGGLGVMTQNVYLGADIDPVLAASTPDEVPMLVASAWSQMQANDFPARARALAKEIATKRPHLIGLQEVALFRRVSGTDGSTTEVDFLKILQKALASRGLSYKVAVVQTDSDVSVPMFAGLDGTGAPILDGVEMIDRDVVLAREDVEISHPTAARYAVGLPISIAGGTVEIVRGWASVVAETERGKIRFVTTHLEDHVPEAQFAQASELLEVLSTEKLPVMLVGDFNSPADGTGTSTYGMLAGAGFEDAWAKVHPKNPGFTCCRPADLHDTSALTQRLDVVFVRPLTKKLACVAASIVGDDPRDRTETGLWPSDHAGLMASFGKP